MNLPNFRIIDPNTSIYLYYAGRDRKYMSLSQASQRIFLDIPGFLTTDETFLHDELIIQSLNRADAVKRYRKDPVNFPQPSGLNFYENQMPVLEGRASRSFIADFSNIRKMFVEMAVGDLVIMTPLAHYDPLLIGEVTTDWNSDQNMVLPDQPVDLLPFREVRWLSTGLSRRDFPTPVARRMQNRKAITEIDSDYYESIFKLVYHSYIWGNVSKLDIFAPLYSSSDPTSNAEASFIIKYAIAYYSALVRGEVELFNDLELEEAAERYFDPYIVEQIAQSFGSPGGYIVRLIGTAAALGVAGIVTVAMSDETQPIQHQQQQAQVQIDQVDMSRTVTPGADISGLATSLRAGRAEELRTKYGRAARSKLGLTLEGQVSPQVTAPDRIGDGQ